MAHFTVSVQTVTGICVISNAVLAKTAQPNAHIVVLEDLCACVTPESHENALNAMRTLQIEVIDSEKAVD
ncbi:MAG: isochorismatase family protein [Lachnospiraceae bacterium]|nr:isochorismatase family protein [Lachnospiraceae bacterium]